MMRHFCGIRFPLTAIPLLLCLGGCVSLRVTSDVNTAVGQSLQCHSFAWAGSFRGNADSLRSSVANPLNEARLRAAIEANLRNVGVQPASSDPDCLVGYGIGMRNVVEGPDPYGWGWGYGYGWGWGGPWGWGWDEPYVYQEGIVAVDVYDAHSRQPLWHASVNQSLAGATGDRARQKIDEAVAAIFAKYPGREPAGKTVKSSS